MSTLKTQKEILDNLPELTDEDFKMLDDEFDRFFFFKEHKNEGYRECWCTHCQKHFRYEYLQRTEPPTHYDFVHAKHNEQIMCPECHTYTTAKETYRMKNCRSLEKWKRLVLIKQRSPNEVYLLCFYGHRFYEFNYLGDTEYDLSAVYYLTPGQVKNIKNQYGYNWYERKRICEPFTKTWGYNHSKLENRGYSICGLNNLKGTFMEYAPVGLFDDEYEKHFYRCHSRYYSYCVGETPFVKMLCYYALYPSIERLMKVGLSEFVCNLIDGRPMKKYIDWNADTPKKMFNMNNAAFNDFRENYYGEIDFKVYQLLRSVKENILYSEVIDIIDGFAGESSVRVVQKIKQYKLNITHTFNYLRKHTKKSKNRYGIDDFDYENTAVIWTDYLKIAAELKYDLSRDDVIFPKNLKKAHDEASANIAVKHDAEAFKKYQSRYEKLRKTYEYSNGEFEIVIPLGVNDIVEEGKILGHCVKGYASRHMEGKTTILFMRNCKKPDTRLITIEINGKTILQNRGKSNRNPTKEEKAFIDEWIEWVKAGSKKNKKKKTAESAA